MGTFKKILPPKDLTFEEQIIQKYYILKENYSEKFTLKQEVFEKAITAYYTALNKGDVRKSGILTIIDYSLPSTDDRFYIIDVENNEVLYQGLVAHGKSGYKYMKEHSNVENSFKTPIGFFITGEEYSGKHGRSLRMDGLEPNNNNSRKRYIVLHEGVNPLLDIKNYVSKEYIDKYGYLGRSQGCFAIEPKDRDFIIDTIKEGTAFFVYFDDPTYLANSEYLNEKGETDKLNTFVENIR